MDLERFAERMSCLDKNTKEILMIENHEPDVFSKFIDNFEQQKEVIKVLHDLPDEFLKASSSQIMTDKEKMLAMTRKHTACLRNMWKHCRVLTSIPVLHSSMTLCSEDEDAHLRPGQTCYFCIMEYIITRYITISNIELNIKQIIDNLSPEDCITILDSEVPVVTVDADQATVDSQTELPDNLQLHICPDICTDNDVIYLTKSDGNDKQYLEKCSESIGIDLEMSRTSELRLESNLDKLGVPT